MMSFSTREFGDAPLGHWTPNSKTAKDCLSGERNLALGCAQVHLRFTPAQLDVHSTHALDMSHHNVTLHVMNCSHQFMGKSPMS